MPHSARENNADVRAWVLENNIETVLDVGAGSGTYAHILRDMVVLDAVEIWKPYVKEFGLDTLYREVMLEDVRDMAWAHWAVHRPDVRTNEYDLVIFGDILEHMTKEEATKVWAWAASVASFGLISIPSVHWPQDDVGGNPFEAHDDEHILPADVRAEFGPFVFEKDYKFTSTFIKEFS